jgi:hypothetical protein
MGPHLLKVPSPPNSATLGTKPLTNGLSGNVYPNHSNMLAVYLDLGVVTVNPYRKSESQSFGCSRDCRNVPKYLFTPFYNQDL